MAKFFKIKITQGDSVGPYDILYTTTGNTEYQFSKLYGTNDDASLISYNDLVTGDGVSIEVPNDTDKIVVFNTLQECEVYVTHYVITPTPTPTLTATPTVTPTNTPTSTETPTPTVTSTPTITESATNTPTPTVTSTPTNTPTTSSVVASFAYLSSSTNLFGNFSTNQTAACNSWSCLNESTCSSNSGTSSYFENYLPEIGDKLYVDNTLTSYYAGNTGYYIKLDTLNLLYVVNGIIVSIDDCPTPTPTPTVTSTPTPTVTSTSTSTPTPTMTSTTTNTPTPTVTSTPTSTPTITPSTGWYGFDLVNQRWLTNPVSSSQPSMGSYGWSRNNSVIVNITKISITTIPWTAPGTNLQPFFNTLTSGDVIRVQSYEGNGYADFQITGKTYNPNYPESYTFDVTLSQNSNWDNTTGYFQDGLAINFYNSSFTQYTSF